jgi:hypothetical protein
MPRLAWLELLPSNNELVRVMTYRVYPALIAFLSAIAVLLAATETFARSGSASHRAFASARSGSHSPFARPPFHHRRNNTGTVWPAVEDGFYGPSGVEPTTDVTQPSPGDVHYTYDIPWDWAHRYPPIVTPSERAYVPSCPTAVVTVPGRDGRSQTVNVTQCF